MSIRKIYKFKDLFGEGKFGNIRVAYRRNVDPRKYYP
jgi:hypothetical protein